MRVFPVLLAACGAREAGPLARLGGWALLTDGDPFPQHASSYAGCSFESRGSYYEEEGRLEVDTGVCGYFVLGQPTLRDVRPGDRLEWSIYHSDLIAEEPALAHVAVALGDEILWDWTVDIPSPTAIYDQAVKARSRAPAGTMLTIHLHNHGQNKWVFLAPTLIPNGSEQAWNPTGQARAQLGVAQPVDHGLRLGSDRWLEDRGQQTPEVHDRLEAMARGGRTVVAGNQTHVCGLVSVEDGRPEAAAAVAALKRAGVSRVVMLTGDNRAAAESVGAAVGVDEVRAELLPEDKVRIVRSSWSAGGRRR